jgi:predicted metalloprotease
MQKRQSKREREVLKRLYRLDKKSASSLRIALNKKRGERTETERIVVRLYRLMVRYERLAEQMGSNTPWA